MVVVIALVWDAESGSWTTDDMPDQKPAMPLLSRKRALMECVCF
jgi:hypothetical protein